MEIKIDYKEAATNKDAFKAIVSHLKVDPQDIKWKYDWAQRVQGMSFGQVLESIHKPKPPEPSVDQKVKDVEKTLAVCLCGGYKRKHKSVKVSVPQFVLDCYRKGYEKDKAEQKRCDALTPEQREAEIQEDLKELSKDPGFMMFSIPVSRRETNEASKSKGRPS